MRLAAVILAGAVLTACGNGGDDVGEAGAGPGGAGGLPDGTYSCIYLSGGMLMHLGEVVISGDRYGGFSGGRRGAYSVGADGAVEFSDGFAGMPDGFEVSSSQWRAGPTPMLAISITSPSGNRIDLDCEPQG